jgi:hypothetical protein
MPNNGRGTGTFTPDGGDGREYTYELDSWVREGEYPTRMHTIDTADLQEVDFIVIESHPTDDPTDVSFDTLWGPFDDWQSIEIALSADYGETGSLSALRRIAA